MRELDNWLRLVIAVLATWRLSHLIAFEDGPWDVIARIRRRANGGFFGRLMDCFYCVSLWVAAPVTILLRPRLEEGVLLWLAISGAACLLDRVGHDPVTIRTYEDGGDRDDAVLRTESGEREESSRRAGPGAG